MSDMHPKFNETKVLESKGKAYTFMSNNKQHIVIVNDIKKINAMFLKYPTVTVNTYHIIEEDSIASESYQHNYVFFVFTLFEDTTHEIDYHNATRLYNQIKTKNMQADLLEEANKIRGKAFKYYDNDKEVTIIIEEVDKVYKVTKAIGNTDEGHIVASGTAYTITFPQHIEKITNLNTFVNNYLLDADEIDYDKAMLDYYNAKIFNIENKIAKHKNKLDKIVKKKNKTLNKIHKLKYHEF